MKILPSRKQFKNYSKPSKIGIIGTLVGTVLGITSVFLVFFYPPFQNWRYEQKMQRVEENLTNYIQKKEWSRYDIELQKVENDLRMKDFYLYHKGYGLMYRSRALERNTDANFYLKQINELSDYFPRSIIFRLTWFKKNHCGDTLYVDKIRELIDELNDRNYKGPEYFLANYLLLINSEEDLIDDIYNEFASVNKYLLDPEYRASFTFYKNDGLVDLSVYSQISALNYLFLNQLLEHTRRKSMINHAYDRLSKLYNSDEALGVVLVGLHELSLANKNISVNYLKQQLNLNLGLEVL